MKIWMLDDGRVRPEMFVPNVGYLYFGDARKAGGSDKYQGVSLVHTGCTMTGVHPRYNKQVRRMAEYKEVEISEETNKCLMDVVGILYNANDILDRRKKSFNSDDMSAMDKELEGLRRELDQPLYELRRLTDTLDLA